MVMNVSTVILLTTHQPRGPLRSEVRFKAANMRTLHNVCLETEAWELCHHVVNIHLAEKTSYLDGDQASGGTSSSPQQFH